VWDCTHHVLNFFPNPARDVRGYLKRVGSGQAPSASSVLRKAGDVLSHINSAFAMPSFLSPVPALQQAVTRSFPACRQFGIHFLWQKEAMKAVPDCFLLLPDCNLLPWQWGWPGCLGSHAITKIAVTIQVKKTQHIFSRRRSFLFSTWNMRGPHMHSCFLK